MSGSPLSSQAGTLSRSLAVFSQFLPLSIGSACLHRALHWLHWIPLECLCLIIIDTDPAFCCNLERCSLTASLISWTSPVAHYTLCNITYLAKYFTTLFSLFSPCPSSLYQVLLQAWGRILYCTLGQDWPNTKSTVSIKDWLCYFVMCHFHSIFFVMVTVFVFTFVIWGQNWPNSAITISFGYCHWYVRYVFFIVIVFVFVFVIVLVDVSSCRVEDRCRTAHWDRIDQTANSKQHN